MTDKSASINHLQDTVIGVDLGGTKILSAKINQEGVKDSFKTLVPKNGSKESVLGVLIHSIEQVIDSEAKAIGVGVPSVVDVQNGIVYDVQNIPSWKEVHLKDILQKHFNLPVFLNNDANCFALGEKYFGKGQNHSNFIGLIVGTGMAAGVIIENKLYNGHNCGAGEFGMIPYKDHILEYYSAGQFFQNVYHQNGEYFANMAISDDKNAQAIYSEFGQHLGYAISIILFALDPDLIIIGGSVSKSYDLYKEAMWEELRKFPFHKVPERLSIQVSELPEVAVLGAASLCYSTL